MPRKVPDFLWLKKNMLTAIEDVGVPLGKRKRHIKCMCECGREAIVAMDNFMSGHTKSCGCKKDKGSRLRHGKSHTTEHNIWLGMKNRCLNPQEPAFKNYGGRGISVCDRWLNSFEAFYADMGPRPSKNHSLDRFPNNNGDYDPGNTRWATRQEQALNTRTTVYHEYEGIRRTQHEWANILGVKSDNISNHIRRGKTFSQTVDYFKNKSNGF